MTLKVPYVRICCGMNIFDVQCTLNMLFVICLLCSLSVLANHRAPSEGEAHAFRTLYGTDDLDKLKEFENKPLQFWQERENALMQEGATMSHLDFCAKFVQDAKQALVKDCPEEMRSYCAEQFQNIDRYIKDMVVNEPALPNVKARYYGLLCDKVHKASPQKRCKVLFAEQKITLSDIRTIVEGYSEMTHAFNERVRWIVSKDGQFSIFDWLVMRRKGYYLCGAPEDPQARFDFSAHEENFSGWTGLFGHDTYAHSFRSYLIDKALEDNNISSQEYFNQCCNPNNFIAGDLIGMSQKALGLFYQFHELPSLTFSFEEKVLCSLVFPHAGGRPGCYRKHADWSDLERHSLGVLPDTGFLDIAPYFMHVPLKYDWYTRPLPRHPMPDCPKNCVHEALLGWRAQHCAEGFDFLPANSMLDYFRAFYFHFSFITSVDRQRDSRFFRQVLRSLYTAEEQKLAPTKGFVCFSDFEKNLEEDVQEFLRKVALTEGRYILLEAPSYFIFVLSTKYAAQCKQIVDKGRNFVFKHSQDAFHLSVRRFCAPTHLEMELHVSVEKVYCKKKKALP